MNRIGKASSRGTSGALVLDRARCVSVGALVDVCREGETREGFGEVVGAVKDGVCADAGRKIWAWSEAIVCGNEKLSSRVMRSS